MKSVSTLFGFLGLCILLLASQAGAQLPFAYSGTGFDRGEALTLDSQGRVSVVFTFENSLDVDPGPGATILSAPQGLPGLGIAQYDRDGNLRWARSLSGDAVFNPHALESDAAGNLYLCGDFGNPDSGPLTVDFDPGPDAAALTHTGGFDPFLLALSPDGNYRWARTWGSTRLSANNETAWDLALDAAGNLYVGGFFTGEYDLDPGSGTNTVRAAGVRDGYLSKFDAAGTFVWGFTLGGGGADEVRAVDVAGGGEVHIAGMFSNMMDADPRGDRADMLSGVGGVDAFIARYAPDGALIWAEALVGPERVEVQPGALTVRPDGTSFLTGNFSGTADFEPGPAETALTNAGGGSDIFVASYFSSGNLKFAFSIASATGHDAGRAITTDANGDVWVTGRFRGEADFDGGPDEATLRSQSLADASDIFLAKYSFFGEYLWARNFGAPVSGSTLASSGNGIAVSPQIEAYITGSFFGNADFDGTDASFALNNAGFSDGFLARYNTDGNLVSPRPAPGCPTPVLTVGQTTGTTAELSWTFAAPEIEIEYRPVGTTAWQRVMGSDVSQLRLEGLTPETTYELRARNRCLNSSSVFSQLITFRTGQPGSGCPTPRNIRAQDLTTTSVTLRWDGTTDANTYEVRYRVVGTSAWERREVGDALLPLADLLPDRTYEVRLRSVCGRGDTSMPASPVFFTTLRPVVLCATPTGLTVTRSTASTADLEWMPVDGAVTYRVEYRMEGASNWNLRTTSTNTLTVNNLIADRTWEYRVQAVCSGSQLSPFSTEHAFSLSSAGRCAIPQEIQVDDLTATNARIRWTPTSGAMRYEVIFREAGTQNWQTFHTGDAFYRLFSLQPETTYEFYLRAECGAVSSSYSGQTAFTTLPQDIPCGTPRNVNAFSVTSNGAELSWQAAEGALRYQVEYRRAGTADWSALETQQTQVRISPLDVGTSYEYRVQSVCLGQVRSDFSPVQAFNTTTVPLCREPVAPRVEAVSENSALLSWGGINDATEYRVLYRPVGSTSWNTLVSPDPFLNILNLSSNREYAFMVQSVCGTNLSGYTEMDFFTTLAQPLACPVPEKLAASALTTSSARITWDDVPAAQGYEFEYRRPGENWQRMTVGLNAISLNGLIAGTNYEYRVRSRCSAELVSDYSPVFFFSTAENLACGTPTNLRALNLTSTSTSLAWDAVNFARSYNLLYRRVGNPDWIRQEVSQPRLSVSGLQPGTRYETYVQAACNAGFSEFTPIVRFTTEADTTVCNIPENLRTGSVGFTEATVRWDAVNRASYYIVEFRTNNQPWNEVVAVGDSVVLDVLRSGTPYEYRVQAVCSGQAASGFSSIRTFATESPNNCVAPVQIRVESVGDTSAFLTWNARTHATGYALLYRETGGTNWLRLTTGVNSTRLTGLTPDTEYEFYIQTTCGTTESVYSAPQLFRTLAGKQDCPVPTSIQVSQVTPTGARLDWNAAPLANGYEVFFREQGQVNWQVFSTAQPHYVFTGLDPLTTYLFSVRSSCVNGDISSNSETGTFLTLAPLNCGAPPANITVQEATPSTATINWQPVQEAFRYNLLYKPSGTNSWFSVSTGTNLVTLTGLAPDRTYELYIQAFCAGSSSSGYSTAFTFETAALRGSRPERADKTAPLRVYPNPTHGTVEVSWTVSGKAPVQFRLLELTGREVWSQTRTTTHTTDTGMQSWTIRLPQLRSGLYVFEIQEGDRIRHQKLQVAR